MAVDIIARCNELGIDHKRLSACLDSHDQWGKLVHSFEYLTVLGVVADAMCEEEALVAATNAKLAEIRTIAMDHADYDTGYLHYIINVIDGHYPPQTDAEKLEAVRDCVDEDDGRPGIAEIAAVL